MRLSLTVALSTMRVTVRFGLVPPQFGGRTPWPKPKRVPLLTARYKALRLGRARQHRHWIDDVWKHVAWSDESCFHLNRSDGRVRVWRQPYEFMDPTCQQGTVQAVRGSMMVWGVCTWHDMGS
ncbi:transposable element Tcb2 transposase [Trichonephila clavipes]|nr:transposable element Tcb2 transposase [Trichonephila clavipes]